MNAKPALVSVIVPAFNAASGIRQTLRSALAQTYRRIEVIVVDDGSTDETSAVVEEIAATDARVRLLRQVNAGVGAARNTGILAAHGHYIAPLDSDDEWSPRKIEAQVARLEQRGPAAGLSYCWSRLIDDEGRVLTWAPPRRLEGHLGTGMLAGNLIGNASVPLFRTSALEKVGLYLTRAEQHGAQGCEDWDLHLRVAEKFQVACVPAYHVSYRQSHCGMSQNSLGMAASYETVMRRALARNPQLDRAVLAWSSERFHSYLARKCYSWGDYRSTLRFMWRTFRADPIAYLNLQYYWFVLGSMIHLCTGGRFRRHPTPPPKQPADPDFCAPPQLPAARNTWFNVLQERRLAAAIHPKKRLRTHSMSLNRSVGYLV